MELPTAENLSRIWTNSGYVPASFNTQADGLGQSFAFGEQVSYETVEALQSNTLYVIWTPLTQCKIHGNFDGADPKFYTININQEGDTTLPTFNQVFERWDRDGVYIPMGLGTSPDDDAPKDFGDQMDLDGFSAINGELYVIWMSLEELSAEYQGVDVLGVIAANRDYVGSRAIYPIVYFQDQVMIADEDELRDWWGVDMDILKLATQADGSGTEVQLGTNLTQQQFYELHTTVLYAIWQDQQGIEGRIMANIPEMDPEGYMPGYFDPEENDFDLPPIQALPESWVYEGHHAVCMNSARDGTGDVTVQFGGTITIQQIQSLIDSPGDIPCLYVIWEED